MSYIEVDPDRHKTEITSRTCSHHKQNPGVPHPGCTCSVTYGQVRVSDEEYCEKRTARLIERRDAIKKELAAIESELDG